MAINLINAEQVDKTFDINSLLTRVSIGISENDRIGIVGRNGGGKSTLVKILAGLIQPDNGNVNRSNSTILGILNQTDLVDPKTKVSEYVLEGIKEHEWLSNSQTREIFKGLFGIESKIMLNRDFASLSGGEKRRASIAKLIIKPLNLIFLD